MLKRARRTWLVKRETRMDYATNLARRHGAHLIGIFLLPPDIGGRPASSYVRGQAAIADLLHVSDVPAPPLR